MGWPIAALVVAALVLVGSDPIPGRQFLVEFPDAAPEEAPTFQRTAVESSLRVRNLEYGGVPSRTAVESMPGHLEARRQPLRDAVEMSLKK
jgi:hypothetical protein